MKQFFIEFIRHPAVRTSYQILLWSVPAFVLYLLISLGSQVSAVLDGVLDRVCMDRLSDESLTTTHEDY